MSISKIVQRYEQLLPNQSDIEFYQKHGWYVSKTILDEDELHELDQAVEQHYQGIRDRRLPHPIKSYLDWDPSQGEGIRISDYIVYQNDTVRRVVMQSVIGAIAARLAGTTRVRLFNSSFVNKPPSRKSPKENRVGWHTDKAYWKTSTSQQMLTAWVPLQDVSKTNGTLKVVSGSHLWEADNPQLHRLMKEKNFVCNNMDELEKMLHSCGKPLVTADIEVAAGQCSFHHCLTLHASGENHSETYRKALILHLQDAANTYQPAWDDSGEQIVYNNDLMCRKDDQGHPDYQDPNFCPALYPL